MPANTFHREHIRKCIMYDVINIKHWFHSFITLDSPTNKPARKNEVGSLYNQDKMTAIHIKLV